jgi:NADH:ubiquinone oxidoreductase subunit F (NADH-binding)/NAD-dependent dihydropyrimidine dehydrogenase PreA subunit/(2Fe-2S) ferredoxin
MTTDNKIRTAADLTRLKKLGENSLNPQIPKISVGTATCGLATGSADVYESFQKEVASRGLEVTVARTGCIGFCQMEPIVYVKIPSKAGLLLKKMSPKLVPQVLDALQGGEFPRQAVLCTMNGDAGTDGFTSYQEIGFYNKQVKIALRNCGMIDPESLCEYVATGGYHAFFKAVTSMKPAEIISAVKRSGLRGRGGAGFPTGRKWEITSSQPSQEKFIICNADEGDPGAYMDRSILEGDPHAVLEGMIIGAFAMGASQGFIYVRDEYPEAIRKFEKAIADAITYGLLGRDILGAGFNFTIKIVRGGGAFVCGEETALLASLMGLTGEPQQRPPFPAQKGLWGRPTNINNVETLANVPRIILEGPEKFSLLGTESSKGTKVFSLVGKVVNTGLIEVPMGLTLREIIFDIGGGVPHNKRFKAIQTGGPSGGCLPEALIDLPVDYEQLTSAGTIMGSGGMIVMDEQTCMVDVARYFLDFLKEESCGKCTPCREGIGQMLSILNAICEGRGSEKDLKLLEEVAQTVRDFSLCGLGQTAPNPVLTTLRYFKNEYLSHIRDHKCPAGVCKALVTFSIDPDTCTGCGACLKACPSGAVSGQAKKVHVIDQTRCIKCNACYEVCKFSAVQRT